MVWERKRVVVAYIQSLVECQAFYLALCAPVLRITLTIQRIR